MSCHVSVYLPSLTRPDCREMIGESVQLVRFIADEIHGCGVPTRDEDGMFSHNENTTPSFEAVLVRLTDLEQHYNAVMMSDTSHEYEDAYRALLLTQRWVALYHTVIELRAHGLAADLFGA